MAPGDNEFGNVRVENVGSLRLRYAMSASADDPDGKALATQLSLRVVQRRHPRRLRRRRRLPRHAGGWTDKPRNTLQTSSVSNAQGPQAGDRELSASSSENLCVRVALPLATGNAFQNATSSITLTFDAEQTANNP